MNELEIKMLNVNIEDIKNKLDSIGAVFKKEVVQKIYTYDCYDPIIMYELIISDYKITKSKNSLQKLVNFLGQVRVVFNDEDKRVFKELTGYEYLEDYVLNNIKNVDIKLLTDKRIKSVIKRTKERFFKWIRLRINGDKIEFTIKYIYNVAEEYNIDDVKEIEINVSDFEEANRLIEEMGYFRKKLVEKKRTSYEYKDNKIEIDEWPLIPPCAEIEGKDVDDIYKTAELLGYKKEETKVMNIEDVYLMHGLNLDDYEVLTFDECVKR